jgi:hypothetical protein
VLGSWSTGQVFHAGRKKESGAATPTRWVAGRLYLSILPAGTRDTLTETHTHGFGFIAICGLQRGPWSMPRGTSAASPPTATKGTPPAPTGPGSNASTHRPQANLPIRRTSVPRSPNTSEQVGGVGVVCCIAADPRLKSMTRTPAPDALRPTKSQPFSIIWEDNTDSVVDLRTLLQIVWNHEQGLYKPSTSMPPPTSNGARAQSAVVSQGAAAPSPAAAAAAV